MAKTPVDPYAPPPMYHERSGALVRIAIIAALLGAGAWAYVTFAQPGQPSNLVQGEAQEQAPAAQQQQLADASSSLPPEAMPQAAPQHAPSTAAAPPPAPAPVHRASAARHEARPAETIPAPTITPVEPAPVTPAPTPAAPLPPDGAPPATVPPNG